MKALLLKDWYLAVKYSKFLMLVSVFFVVLAGLQDAGDQMFIVLYPGILCSVLPVTLLSYDEREKWDRYVQTMPLSRKAQVSSKYLIGLLLSTSIVILATCSSSLRLLLTGEMSVAGIISFFLMLETFVLLPPTVMMPIVIKFGTEKGRLVYFVFIAVACGGAAVLTDFGYTNKGALTLQISDGLLFAGAALLYVASWMISIKLYENKEIY